MCNLPPLSLYIHIPWCLQKCAYCDFNSHVIKTEIPHNQYVNHLIKDLENDLNLITKRNIHTIFIGGGTPNLLSISAIKLLIDSIRKRLNILPHTEITIEVNPNIGDIQNFILYQQIGINRISIGIQTFDHKKLTYLKRMHNGDEAKKVANFATSIGLSNVNFDLMYGLPHQNLIGALNDLTYAINLSPQHLSWYQLTIEPYTFFQSQPPLLPNDDILWQIYNKGNQLLHSAGYLRYETSAYSKDGFQCQHNLNYWRFGDYIGIGCGAHGKITKPNGAIIRTIKTNYPKKYMTGQYLFKSYLVSQLDLPIEYFMNRFRLFEVIPRSEFTAYTGLKEHKIRHILDKILVNGYIIESTKYWQITEKGKLFLNSLLEYFI